MNTHDFLKTRQFALVYWHSSFGLNLKLVHDFFSRDNKESLIISARVGGLIHDNLSYTNKNIKIEPLRGKGGLISEYSDRLDIFFWLTSSKISDVKKLLRNNPSERDVIREIYKCYSASINEFHTAIFLCDFTNENVESINSAFSYYHPLQCLKVVTGGLEVVYEYLFSDFIKESDHPDLSKPFLCLDEEEQKALDMMPDYPYSTLYSDVYFSPSYKFKSNSNLDHLTETVIYYDSDEFGDSWEKKGGAYPYYKLRLSALEKIKKEFSISDRVSEILTNDQKNFLDSTKYNVLENNLVHIFENVFRYDYRKYSETPVAEVPSEEKSWNYQMYDALGGDGRGSVYLGDGLSINSNGDIIDD
jgi:hypothetical protein